MPRTEEEGHEDEKIVAIGDKEIPAIELTNETENHNNTVTDENNPWILRLTLIGESLQVYTT